MGVEDPVVVESLANLHIDPAFVLDPEHRPKRKHNDYSTSGGHVPVIDLAPLRHEIAAPQDTPAVDDIVAKVGQACEQWGFFQVINHGVPAALLEELQSTAKQFFDLPLEEKRKVPSLPFHSLHFTLQVTTHNNLLFHFWCLMAPLRLIHDLHFQLEKLTTK